MDTEPREKTDEVFEEILKTNDEAALDAALEEEGIDPDSIEEMDNFL